jgi:hypothetical protein
MGAAIPHAGGDALWGRSSRAPPHQLRLGPQQLVQLAQQGVHLHDYLYTPHHYTHWYHSQQSEHFAHFFTEIYFDSCAQVIQDLKK